ncbi:hypothetical protein B5X24_HaOG207923 [Helicoverpa armigera]|uniref:Uncharacterized protein n=1 Tax=Helicoverpa armigera TaxID=29058 RepID=A0A2W1BNQ0_HELAM|nr:hypothetical protein B5X24_HaOG207923 [Helicoverpa armigera]
MKNIPLFSEDPFVQTRDASYSIILSSISARSRRASPSAPEHPRAPPATPSAGARDTSIIVFSSGHRAPEGSHFLTFVIT